MKTLYRWKRSFSSKLILEKHIQAQHGGDRGAATQSQVKAQIHSYACFTLDVQQARGSNGRMQLNHGLCTAIQTSIVISVVFNKHSPSNTVFHPT